MCLTCLRSSCMRELQQRMLTLWTDLTMTVDCPLSSSEPAPLGVCERT